MKQTWCRFDDLTAEIDEWVVEETAGTGNAFPDFTYEYDKVGNISKLTTLSTAGTDSQTYTYDDLNRLLTAAATGGVANYSHTYAYNQLGNMTSGPSGNYDYTYWHANCTSPPSQPLLHAVHKIGSYYFCYDNNGNMTTRSDSTGTYTQAFDVENRLTSVTPSGGSATTFAYDANGIRTKTVQPGGMTTYFPFPGYEETVNGANTIKRSTYSFAGQTVAMRVSGDPVSGNNGLFYVLSDHLGSTSMLVNSSGGVVAGSTTRNLPYGGYRPGSAPTQTITDRDFTGQKENMELGLLYYQARFYVPGIGRFASADTIVPNPASPQSYNRYSYVLNSPINLTDPSGHNPLCSSNGLICSDTDSRQLINFEVADGVDEVWTVHEILAVMEGATDVDTAFKDRGSSFLEVYGGSVTFRKTGQTCEDATGDPECFAQTQNSNLVHVFHDIYDGNDNSRIPDERWAERWTVHELAHAFESRVNGQRVPYQWGYVRNQLPADILNRDGFAGSRPGWQQSASTNSGEIFADMFIGWVNNEWETNPLTGMLTDEAQSKRNFMTTNMSDFIGIAIGQN